MDDAVLEADQTRQPYAINLSPSGRVRLAFQGPLTATFGFTMLRHFKVISVCGTAV